MNKSSVKKFLKWALPEFIHPFGRKILRFRHFLHTVKRKRELEKHYSDVHKRYKHNLCILNKKMSSNKEKIRCVYFALDQAVWKCDGMYMIMKQSNYFEPIILVCPIVNYGRENMLKQMDACYYQMKKKGYDVWKAYDLEKDKYIDVYKDLNPDIIVYTNPYEGLIDNRYYIKNFENILTIYIPYFFGNNIDYSIVKHLFTKDSIRIINI